MSDRLRRDLAPISEAAWKAIDEEATRTLRHYLAARPLIDFQGPHGWAYSATSQGRVDELAATPGPGVEGRLRRILPVVELRTPLVVDRAELDAIDRGADPDLSPVVDAARRAAHAEDKAIFYGYPAGAVTGIVDASPHQALSIGDDYNHYPRSVAKAVAALRASGVGGPYGLALGPRCYTGVIESTENGGYPVLEHIRRILDGPVLWAPAADGAIVVSLRGGDYTLDVGQDFSLGYLGHSDTAVHLYLEESFTFRVAEEGAAIALRYPG